MVDVKEMMEDQMLDQVVGGGEITRVFYIPVDGGYRVSSYTDGSDGDIEYHSKSVNTFVAADKWEAFRADLQKRYGDNHVIKLGK